MGKIDAAAETLDGVQRVFMTRPNVAEIEIHTQHLGVARLDAPGRGLDGVAEVAEMGLDREFDALGFGDGNDDSMARRKRLQCFSVARALPGSPGMVLTMRVPNFSQSRMNRHVSSTFARQTPSSSDV